MPQYFSSFIKSFKGGYSISNSTSHPSTSLNSSAISLNISNDKKIDTKFYNLLMLFVFSIGVSLICFIGLGIPCVVPIILLFLLTIIILLRRPFLKSIQNVRFVLNMLISIIIQAVYICCTVIST